MLALWEFNWTKNWGNAPIVLPSLYLLDGNGHAWLLGVTNAGLITTTLSSSPTVSPVTGIFLLDSLTVANWQVVVTTTPIAGIPQTVPTATATLRKRISVQAPDGQIWAIQALNGILQTIPIVSCLSALIGTLYEQNHNNVPWTQPGGPGTVVFPQQQSGPFANYPVPGQFFIEQSGLWSVGCGHFVDYPWIFRDFDQCTGESVAVVACPMCSYIQYLIEPFELFDDPVQNAITII
jgi:hypothetical protein